MTDLEQLGYKIGAICRVINWRNDPYVIISEPYISDNTTCVDIALKSNRRDLASVAIVDLILDESKEPIPWKIGKPIFFTN